MPAEARPGTTPDVTDPIRFEVIRNAMLAATEENDRDLTDEPIAMHPRHQAGRGDRAGVSWGEAGIKIAIQRIE